MYYGYHLTEAYASFKEAARYDSSCAMAYWGQALSMGPYYNTYTYKMPPAVLPILAQMNGTAMQATEKENDLIDAMNKRYSPDTSDSKRNELNRLYTARLSELVRKYPDDIDIKAFYVDAVMLEHTWDFWDADGNPKLWTAELVTLCDQILQRSPTHPAALHYQIHLVEASQHPEKALHNADVLQASMPGIPHMVHMSSHMYQRNGLYAKGVEVNDRASLLQANYDSAAPNLKLGMFSLTHFDGVGAFCAINANMYDKAMQSSMHLRKILSTTYRPRLGNTFFQYLYMMPMFASVRSGHWETVVSDAVPDSNLHYAVLLDHFGKGIASLRLHDAANARLHLDKLRLLLADSLLQIRNLPFNAPAESGKIAEHLLAGELLLSEKKYNEAVQELEAAVSAEHKLIYREPKEWVIPARHFLGACLLQASRALDAEKVYREDLLANPGNGWALLGLYQSLMKQHKTKQANQYKTAYKRAFADASELPPASVY